MSKTKQGICAYCHTKFNLSRKQSYRMKHGNSVYCSEECALAKRGRSKVVISDIPCKNCGNFFYPTKAQYSLYKSNNFLPTSYCSDKCRYTRNYEHKDMGDYVIVYVGGKEVLLDKDTYEKYYKTIYLHRKGSYISVKVFIGVKQTLARLIMNVASPTQQVDHINGNTLDNRRANLRVVTHQENMMNKTDYKNNSSGVKGVNMNHQGLWVARIQVGGKRVFLGSSKDKDKAIELRLEAEKKYFGKYDRKYLK